MDGGLREILTIAVPLCLCSAGYLATTASYYYYYY